MKKKFFSLALLATVAVGGAAAQTQYYNQSGQPEVVCYEEGVQTCLSYNDNIAELFSDASGSPADRGILAEQYYLD